MPEISREKFLISDIIKKMMIGFLIPTALSMLSFSAK
jgi:hypothetical protein